MESRGGPPKDLFLVPLTGREGGREERGRLGKISRLIVSLTQELQPIRCSIPCCSRRPWMSSISTQTAVVMVRCIDQHNQSCSLVIIKGPLYTYMHAWHSRSVFSILTL